MGVHFKWWHTTYKLTTFPSGWEVWKRLLQSVEKGENRFETRFLVCKVSGSSFPSGGIQGACNFSKWVGGVEETSSKCCKFLSVEECSSSL